MTAHYTGMSSIDGWENGKGKKEMVRQRKSCLVSFTEHLTCGSSLVMAADRLISLMLGNLEEYLGTPRRSRGVGAQSSRCLPSLVFRRR